ncbi:f-box domain-containing protein [Fusarium mundagurra]|uniref:F-box domain-containing protein n=1 Tax=Fusarium mundagurra TaxID=1567541 RepID=A0A8H6DPG3_9HYPO|nr:f-box domain-containing protein [Fusarium mundagurra]
MRSEEPPVRDEDEGIVASWGVLVSRMFGILRIVSQVYNLVIAQACNASCEKDFLIRKVGYMVLSIASCDRKSFNLVDAEQLKLPYTAVDRMDKLTRIAYGILEGDGSQQPRELVPTLLSGYHDGRKSPGSAPSTTSYWMGSVFVYLTATKLSKLTGSDVEKIVEEAVAKGREVKPEFRMIVFSIWDFILVEVTPGTVAPSQHHTLWTSRPVSPADDNCEPEFRMFLFEPHCNFAKLASFFLHEDRSDDLTEFGISRKLRVVNQDNGALPSLPLPDKEDIEREGLLSVWNFEEGQTHFQPASEDTAEGWERAELEARRQAKKEYLRNADLCWTKNEKTDEQRIAILVVIGTKSKVLCVDKQPKLPARTEKPPESEVNGSRYYGPWKSCSNMQTDLCRAWTELTFGYANGREQLYDLKDAKDEGAIIKAMEWLVEQAESCDPTGWEGIVRQGANLPYRIGAAG